MCLRQLLRIFRQKAKRVLGRYVSAIRHVHRRSPGNQLRLPTELLPLVLDYADNATLATCLRVSHDAFRLAGKRLYREITYDPNNLLSSPDLSLPSRLMPTLLSCTECLALYHHENASHIYAPLHLPDLQTLRLILQPWHSDSVLCSQQDAPVCPFISELRPTTLIIENLYSIYADHPKGLAPRINKLPPLFSNVTRLVIKPTRVENRGNRLGNLYGFRNFNNSIVFGSHIPKQTKEVVVIFEAMPSETWPRWYQAPALEWPRRPVSLWHFVGDLECVCGREKGRKVVIVNAGGIEPEMIELAGKSRDEVERTIEEEFREEISEQLERWRHWARIGLIADGRPRERYDHEEDLVWTDGEGDEEMVSLGAYGEVAGKGVLQSMVREAWRRKLAKAARENIKGPEGVLRIGIRRGFCGQCCNV